MENEERDLLLQQSKDFVTRLSTALEESMKVVEKQKKTIEEMVPLAQFGSAVIDSKKHYSWDDAAKLLAEKLYEGKQLTGRRGRNKMLQFLRECEVVRSGKTSPYQRFVDQGLFVVKIIENEHIGELEVTRVTGKGLQWLLEKLIEWEYTEWLGVKDKKVKK